MIEGGVVAAIPPLVQASDLAGFPGAPFAQSVIDAAATSLRAAAGWHVAPEVTMTVTLDSDGARFLRLPTGRLLEVVEVRDVSGAEPVVLTGWRTSFTSNGLMRSSWPCGFGVIEVDMRHGYESCPADLLKVVASDAQRRARQQAAGPFSVTFEADVTAAGSLADAVAPYKLGPRP